MINPLYFYSLLKNYDERFDSSVIERSTDEKKSVIEQQLPGFRGYSETMIRNYCNLGVINLSPNLAFFEYVKGRPYKQQLLRYCEQYPKSSEICRFDVGAVTTDVFVMETSRKMRYSSIQQVLNSASIVLDPYRLTESGLKDLCLQLITRLIVVAKAYNDLTSFTALCRVRKKLNKGLSQLNAFDWSVLKSTRKLFSNDQVFDATIPISVGDFIYCANYALEHNWIFSFRDQSIDRVCSQAGSVRTFKSLIDICGAESFIKPRVNESFCVAEISTPVDFKVAKILEFYGFTVFDNTGLSLFEAASLFNMKAKFYVSKSGGVDFESKGAFGSATYDISFPLITDNDIHRINVRHANKLNLDVKKSADILIGDFDIEDADSETVAKFDLVTPSYLLLLKKFEVEAKR